MKALALVTNPCFYKGFFSTTDNLWTGNFLYSHSCGIMYLSVQKSYFSELINFRQVANMI
jgi:hypothetical protein